jgi:hypothetical protein
MYPDGGGLYLQVTTGGPLGSTDTCSIAEPVRWAWDLCAFTAYRKRARRRWMPPAYVTKVSIPSKRGALRG